MRINTLSKNSVNVSHIANVHKHGKYELLGDQGPLFPHHQETLKLRPSGFEKNELSLIVSEVRELSSAPDFRAH